MRDWTSENESHDPQCRERHGTRCSQCGERYHEDDITYIDGKAICCDCLKEYIEEYGKEHAEDFIEDFISANLDARAEDFWKNDLDEQTKKNGCVVCPTFVILSRQIETSAYHRMITASL